MISDSQKWLILAGVFLTGWLLYLLAPVLTPFLIAALLSYLGDPLVDRLEAKKLSRTVGVLIVFSLLLLMGLVLLLVLVPMLQNQILILIDKIPLALQWMNEALLPRLSESFGVDIQGIDPELIRKAISGHWQQVGNVLGQLVKTISSSGQVLIGWLVTITLIPVVSFYLLRDWDHMVAHIRDLLPRNREPTIAKLSRECDAVLAEFMRGQLLVMLALSSIYILGLWIVGLDLALLIGMLAGLVSFVPYLGFVVGIVVAGFAAVMQFHDVIHVVYVAMVFGVGQALEGMVLSPLLVGDRIGLHPVAVIFAVMAGGQLFGFFGVLLALPVAAVIVVLLRHTHQLYLNSDFYTP